VFYNTGHGHLGWTLSAVTADMIGTVVDQALGSQPASPVLSPLHA
jgi:D-amino-acid dehydrogenase